MSDKSKYLLRANVALTSNVKLVVDSKYNLFLESYDSNDILSDYKYKKFQISHETFLSERIAKFYKNLPIDQAFEVRNDISSDMVQQEYKNQYDDIYYSGAREIEYNKHIEEFQYNTTLKIEPNALPKHFFIFRIPGTGLDNYADNVTEQVLYDFSNHNLIHTTDMNYYTNLGKFLLKNYINDDEIPDAPFELNLNAFEFSKWNGYNYYTGGTISKSAFLDDHIKSQDNDFDFEKYITEGFQKNGVICSNYINMTHLFDDTNASVFIESNNNQQYTYKVSDHPYIFDFINKGDINKNNVTFIDNGTVDDISFIVNRNISYRNKWSINRYSGFYADNLKLITTISPYITSDNINYSSDIFIVDNIFKDINNENISPFKTKYDEKVPVYLKINKTFYLIEQSFNLVNNVKEYYYHLISDELFNGNLLDIYNSSNKTILIKYVDFGTGFKNYIMNSDLSMFSDNHLNFSKGVLLINMFGKFYSLIREENNGSFNYFINTDEIINCDNVSYTSQLLNNIYTESTKVPSKDMNIVYFNVYSVEFTDVEDFDFTHMFTEHANYEYETRVLTDSTINSALTNCELLRPIFFEYNFEYSPKDVLFYTNYRYYLPTGNKMFEYPYILPSSSEYSANGDLYMIDNLNLTKIWDINQSVNKFGFAGSNDINSLPYKLNNSFDFWGVNNKGFDINEKNISIDGHNLDWFYSFGTPLIDTNNTPVWFPTSTPHFYRHEYFRSLNIDTDYNFGFSFYRQNNIEFNYDYYLKEKNYDYLDYFLSRTVLLNYLDIDQNTANPIDPDLPYSNYNEQLNVRRYSILNETDNSLGSIFMYKGLSGYISYNKLEDNSDINSESSSYLANDLSNYKLSSIFTKRETEDNNLWGKSGIEFIINKYHKHILICVYIYVGYGELTEIEYASRDELYKNDNYIKYTITVPGTSYASSYYESEIKYSDITLQNIFHIMKYNLTDYGNFSQGISYKIIEPIKKYNIISTTFIGTHINLTFNEDVHFEQGDIIINNNTNVRCKVISKLNNNTIKIDYNININININDIFSIDISPKPFIFNMLEYNKVDINLDVNKLNTENSKLTTSNNIKILANNNSNIKIGFKDNVLYPLHNTVDDSMYYKNKYPSNIDNKTQLKINRYSGIYEPILNSLNIFNNAELENYSNDDIVGEFNSINNELILTIDKLYFNNMFNEYNNLINNFVIYVPKDSFTAIIDYTLTDYMSTIYKIKTNNIDNTKFDLYLTVNKEILLPLIYKIKLLYIHKSNTYFDVNKRFSGVIREQLFAKVDPNLASTRDIRLIYPKLDEHGITHDNRNIFMFNWHKEYFNKKIKNNYNLI